MTDSEIEPCPTLTARFPQSLHDQLDLLVKQRRKNPRYRKYTKTDALIEVVSDGLVARALAAKAEHSDEFKQFEEAYMRGEIAEWVEDVGKHNPHFIRALKAVLNDEEKRTQIARRQMA